MTTNDKVFAGSIPEFYDTYLVPLIFEAYAEDIATRAASLGPKAVLEIAAGSGVVTRALAPKLEHDTRYVASDLNQPMLNHAALRQDNNDRIIWQQADALNLPFDDGDFDVVICQFGVMFFPDRIAGYKQARRVLKPGGKLIFNVWDSIIHNEFADIVTQTAATVFADDPPEFLARTPHGYHDRDVIKTELENAGFLQIEIDTIEESSTAPSPRHPAIAYCQGTPLLGEIEARNADLLDHVTELATRNIAELFGDGEVSGKIQGHVITVTA